MDDDAPRHGLTVPLDGWVSLHPAALAAARGEIAVPVGGDEPLERSSTLAAAIATTNRRWGNPVDGELDRWLAGAAAVVTGQQPGLLGGPLLTLVKACAVAAEVRLVRAGGRDAVGFLWLATADDDLPEMGWARAVAGDQVLEVREEGWKRGQATASAAVLGEASAALLDRLREQMPSEFARAAIDVAASCYAAGDRLGEATGRLLGRLLAGTGVVLVDATDGALARAAAPVLERILSHLPQAWAALANGTADLAARGWTPPLRISSATLPLFAFDGDRRHRVATHDGACPPAILAEVGAHPERFLPNAWLRPLVQDAALATSVAVLGGAELAYHVQAAGLWELAGLPRPEWRLRPHVTVVTAAERRVVRQLGLEAEELLHRNLPSRLLPGGRARRSARRLAPALTRQLDKVAAIAEHEFPALRGDVDATRKRLEVAARWLEERVEAAASRAAEVDAGRWRRLRAFLRPHGLPQERELSVLAPVLRLGLDWPARLIETIDPRHPGMHLLGWEEGGAW